MGKIRMALDDKDIEKIKNARTENMSSYLIMFFAFGVFLIGIITSKEDLSKEGKLVEYMFWLVPIIGFLGSIKLMLNYTVDLLRGFKIVSNAYCIRHTDTGEGTSHYVRIDDKEFSLTGYNEQYFSCFSEKSELYELHFAPWSRVILQVKKIRA